MNENAYLHETCKDARRAIYYALKTDKVDMALGKALNSYPERE